MSKDQDGSILKILGDEAPWMDRVPAGLLDPWADKVAVINAHSTAPTDTSSQSCVAVTNYMDPAEVVSYVANSNVGHLVQYPHNPFAESLVLAARMISEPEKMIDAPWESLWLPNPETNKPDVAPEVWRFPFRSSTEKNQILQNVCDTVGKIKRSSRLEATTRFICDEFFTNAIFWGPRLQTRESTFAKLRGTNYQYPDGFESEMFASKLGDRLIVGCKDPFGSLNVDLLLKRYSECNEKGVGKAIQFDEVSAGIGLFLVFQHAPKLMILVEEGKASVVACEFPLQGSLKGLEALPKNFHYQTF